MFTDLGSWGVGAPYSVKCAEGYRGEPVQVQSARPPPYPHVYHTHTRTHTHTEPCICPTYLVSVLSQVACVSVSDTASEWQPVPQVWSGCEPILCDEPVPKNGYAFTAGALSYGTTRSASCVPGYTGTATSITCQENSQWSSPTGCTVKSF